MCLHCVKSLSFIFWISKNQKWQVSKNCWTMCEHSSAKGKTPLSIHLSCTSTRFEPSSSAQSACRPTNSATDSLKNIYSIIALFPCWGPSCSRTTTCNRLCRPLFCRNKRLESRLPLFASRTVSSPYCRLEYEAAFPIWRTLESHTRRALIHCARIRWWTGTYPTKLRHNQIKS